MTREETAALGLLSAELGVQRAYTDAGGARRVASRAALAAVCTALGWQVDEDGRGAAEALRALRADRSARLADPVHVAWEGRSAGVPLRLRSRRRIEWSLRLEDGTQSAGAATPDRLAQGGE